MKIESAEFVVTAMNHEHYPPAQYPEIAFIGRSNVGKSSMINSLINRKKLVKTSSTPGKTRAINFFLINQRWMFVDLPGYGYARVPADIRQSWRPMVEAYLKNRENLTAVVLIMDFRLAPTQYDLQMIEWLDHHDVPFLMVATKADKIRRNGRRKMLGKYMDVLGHDTDRLIVFSSNNGEGREAVWRHFREIPPLERW
jgi:GTP-binding protein